MQVTRSSKQWEAGASVRFVVRAVNTGIATWCAAGTGTGNSGAVGLAHLLREDDEEIAWDYGAHH